MEISEHLKMNEPNAEQKQAIEHTGGVLLSAGAGSGKTFVLVEHIVYLFLREYESLENPDLIVFSKRLKDKFSKIVLMTFTKKAAGELSLRLQKRFEKGYERAKHNLGEIPTSFWDVALSSIHYMFVGTIHSFCYRLISEGHIPGFTGAEEMSSDLELSDKIDKLFSAWIERNEEKLKEESFEFIIVNKKIFRSQLKEIFSDTDLRLLWTQYNENIEPLNLEGQIEEYYDLELGIDWENLCAPVIGEERMPKKISAWVTFLQEFEASVDRSNLLTFLNSVGEYYKNYARHPSVGAKKDADDIKLFLSQVKSLRDFFNSYCDDFNACLENEEVFLRYGKTTFDIYNFIEGNYLRIPGLTFTDLEYYVWKAVTENKQVVNQISSCYDYFIIDEFQDTSNVQFEIVKSITSGDMGKVFSVGDVKQAIYGFRGGELGVFKEASETTYQTLNLQNNYRSDGNIIDFNNSLFDFLLPSGEGFGGDDEYSVPMLKQTIPAGKENSGAIEKHRLLVKGELPKGKRSITAVELNYLEAEGVFNYLQKSCDNEEICVLYRKLTPVKFLIERLLKSELGFTCQVKVNLPDDPFIFLFCEYTRTLALFDKSQEVQLSAEVLQKIFKILNIEIDKDDIFKYYKEGYQKYLSLGLWESFKLFVWKLNLSSSNLDNCYDLLKFLADKGDDLATQVFEKVSNTLGGEQYSLDFQSGENPERIKIMTMHASKGLEFGTVILGGIHTNGIEKSDQNYFGKIPYSYKWFLSAKKSHIYRSPRYLYEEYLKKKKSFSEAKRLFYVAGTRAVHKLVWFDIEHELKPLSHGKSSWVNGIRAWENNGDSKDIKILEAIKSGTNEKPLDLTKIDLLNKRLDLHPPIFHIDPLGILAVKEEVIPMGYSSELSVTRLAELTRCPRKFFLKNLVKLSEDDVEEVVPVENEADKPREDDFFSEDDLFHGGSYLKNSAERGTLIHEAISQMVKHNMAIPRDLDVDPRGLEGIRWVKDYIEKRIKKFEGEDIELFSETPLKFPFFGQMISGTPDFYIQGGEVLEIWDFKTGVIAEEKMAPYWFQLYCYALALGDNLKEHIKVKLVLSFIDEKNNLEKEFCIAEIKRLLFREWKKLEHPDQINREHCSFCTYSQLCFPT